MARNFFKTIAEANVNSQYDTNLTEMSAICRFANESGEIFKALGWAFQYGYVMGHRATIKGVYEEQGKRETTERLAELESIANKYGLFEPKKETKKKKS